MKKLLLTLALVTGLTVSASNADAIQISLDVSSLGLGSGDGITQLFDQFQFSSQTTSTDLDGIPGGAFTDVGSVRITGFIAPTITDQEGINSAWTLTAVWSDLSGSSSVTATGFDYTYTSGTMKIYATAGVPNNFDGDGDGIFEGANDDTGFTAGTEIASLSLVSGDGLVDLTSSLGPIGTSQLFWQFDTMESGIWKDEFGNDLESQIPLVLAMADSNTDNFVFNADGTIWSDQDGSFSVNVNVVPEPATMLLFGSGLVGFIAKRKKRA